MIVDLQQSKTWENLNTAFTSEARLTMLYRLWAERARRDGQHATSQIFEKTAENEISHARLWYEFLHPSAPGAQENLASAAQLEHKEWNQAYATFAQVAREEGFGNIAQLFDLVGGIENQPEQTFMKQLNALESGTATHADSSAEWICQTCGYHFTGTDAPAVCPVCGKNASYFKQAQA